jgi:hypothetical protein
MTHANITQQVLTISRRHEPFRIEDEGVWPYIGVPPDSVDVIAQQITL